MFNNLENSEKTAEMKEKIDPVEKINQEGMNDAADDAADMLAEEVLEPVDAPVTDADDADDNAEQLDEIAAMLGLTDEESAALANIQNDAANETVEGTTRYKVKYTCTHTTKRYSCSWTK